MENKSVYQNDMARVVISSRLSIVNHISYFQNLWTEHWTGVRSGIGTDLTIVAATGVVMRVHQSILLPLSPLLSQTIQSAKSCDCQGNVPTLILPDRSPEDVRRLLELVYTGSCVISNQGMYVNLIMMMSDMGLVIPGERLKFIPITKVAQSSPDLIKEQKTDEKHSDYRNLHATDKLKDTFALLKRSLPESSTVKLLTKPTSQIQNKNECLEKDLPDEKINTVNNNLIGVNNTYEETKYENEVKEKLSQSEVPSTGNFKLQPGIFDRKTMPVSIFGRQTMPVIDVIHEQSCKENFPLKPDEPISLDSSKTNVDQEQNLSFSNMNLHENDLTASNINANQHVLKDHKIVNNEDGSNNNFESPYNCYICDLKLQPLTASVYLHYASLHFSEQLLADFGDRMEGDKCLDCGTEVKSLHNPYWFLVHMGVKHKGVEKYLPAHLHIGANLNDSKGRLIPEENIIGAEHSLLENVGEENKPICLDWIQISSCPVCSLEIGCYEANEKNNHLFVHFKDQIKVWSDGMRRVYSYPSTMCPQCKEEFRDDNSLYKHLGSIHNLYQRFIQRYNIDSMLHQNEAMVVKDINQNEEPNIEAMIEENENAEINVKKENHKTTMGKELSKQVSKDSKKKEGLTPILKKCNFCAKEFKSIQRLRLHYGLVHFRKELEVEMKPLFENKQGSCPKDSCHKVFKSFNFFKNHMAFVHREVDKYVDDRIAEVCAKKKRSYSRAKYRVCPLCAKKSRSYNCVNHMVTHYYNDLKQLLRPNDKQHAGPLQCAHCEKMFENLNDLIHHSVESHDVLKFVCTDEDNKFIRAEEETTNVSVQFSKIEKITVLPKSKKKGSKSLPSQQGIPYARNSRSMKTQSKSDKCKICKKPMRNMAALLQHLCCHFRKELTQEFSEEMSQTEPNLTCPKCNNNVAKSTFIQHVGAMHKEVLKYAPWVKSFKNKAMEKSKSKGMPKPYEIRSLELDEHREWSKNIDKKIGKKRTSIFDFKEDDGSHDSENVQYKPDDLVFAQLGQIPPWPAKVSAVTKDQIWPYNNENVKRFSGINRRNKLTPQLEQGLKEIEVDAQLHLSTNDIKPADSENPAGSDNPSVSGNPVSSENPADSDNPAGSDNPTPSDNPSVSGDPVSSENSADLDAPAVSNNLPGTDNPSSSHNPAQSDNPKRKVSKRAVKCLLFPPTRKSLRNTPVGDQMNNTYAQTEIVIKRGVGEPSPNVINPSQASGGLIRDEVQMEGIVPLDESPLDPPSTPSILVPASASPGISSISASASPGQSSSTSTSLIPVESSESPQW